MLHAPSDLLETALERLTGKISLALASHRDASLIGLKAWMELHKIPPGAEVVVSGLDNDSVMFNCRLLGLTVLIADVDPDTLQPTLETIKAAKAKTPLAVIVRSYAGYPCQMDDLYAWCKARRITLMEDASDCLPSRYKTWQNGGWPSDMTFFRFLGGSVLAMRDLRLYALAKAQRTVMHASNAKGILDEVHDMQLRYERRRQTWDLYNKVFEDIESLDLPWEDSRSLRQACSRYPLRVQSRQREISQELASIGMPMTLPLIPLYKTSWEIPPVLLGIDDYLDRGVTLPVNISPVDVKRVVEVVKSVVL